MHFSPSSLFVGKPTLEFQSIDSTNNYAMDLITNGNPSEGTTIITQYQTAGKGQYGRKWESEEGKNLMLSIILKPTFIPVSKQFDLTIMTSVSLAMLLESYIDKSIYIKWPNDIYINKKKVCGVLIQNTMKKNNMEYSVIGIGINVNQSSFSSDLPNPTSMRIESSENINLQQLRDKLYSTIESNYITLKNQGVEKLKEAYEERLFLRNEKHTFIVQEDQEMIGAITGVKDDGQLTLETNGQQHSYQMNEIKYNL